MDYQQLKKYVGNENQLFSASESRLTSGRMDGMRVIEVSTFKGLVFKVLPDRCMDIYSVCYKGKNLSFQSSVGMAHPAYYEQDAWLKTFSAGFLTTCGLQNTGVGCLWNGAPVGMHGGISTTPAEQVCTHTTLHDGQPVLRLSGLVRETALFERSLTLHREIECGWNSAQITITDTIQNQGFTKQPYQILYHMNMGYPLLSEKATLQIPATSVRGRDAHAAENLNSWRAIQPPQPTFQEQCYYHDIPANSRWVQLDNPEADMQLHIGFEGAHLDHFVQWKKFQQGAYVMGLEPCNSTIDGIEDAKANGSLKWLKPQETTRNQLTITLR